MWGLLWSTSNDSMKLLKNGCINDMFVTFTFCVTHVAVTRVLYNHICWSFGLFFFNYITCLNGMKYWMVQRFWCFIKIHFSVKSSVFLCVIQFFWHWPSMSFDLCTVNCLFTLDCIFLNSILLRLTRCFENMTGRCEDHVRSVNTKQRNGFELN